RGGLFFAAAGGLARGPVLGTLLDDSQHLPLLLPRPWNAGAVRRQSRRIVRRTDAAGDRRWRNQAMRFCVCRRSVWTKSRPGVAKSVQLVLLGNQFGRRSGILH